MQNFCVKPAPVSEDDLNQIHLNSDEYRSILDMYHKNPKSVCVHMKFCKGEDEYVQITFYRPMTANGGIRQFRIRKGYSLPLEDEEIFDGLTRLKNLYIDTDNLSKVKEDINGYFSGYNIPDCDASCIGMYLNNLYYATHRCGAREILYLTGLSFTAFNLDRIEDCNLIGSNPAAILEMPMKLVKILDSLKDIKRLGTKQERDRQIAIYKEYAVRIGKELPTSDQWRYLEEDCWDEPFNHSLYKRLGREAGSSDLYHRYRELSDSLGDHDPYKGSLPSSDKLIRAVQILEKISLFLPKIDELDEAIAEIAKNDLFKYEDDKYVLIPPRSVSDICEEAIAMNNCLIDYVWRISTGEAGIVFLRERSNEGKAHVAIEIKGGRIDEMRAVNNEIPNLEVIKFAERYAKAKGLAFDIYSLYLEDSEDELFDHEEIIEYWEANVERKVTGYETYTEDGFLYPDL